ncbi:MAG: EI24 domain-containing protein [Leptonema sp. (in: Bacteria)]|nr:EI24 domain-containing protein [Leptonema sp. (in: bacteria)]
MLAVGIYFLTLELLEWVISFIEGSFAHFLLSYIWIIALIQAILIYFISYRFIAAAFVLPFLGPLQDHLETIRFGQKKETELGNDIKNIVAGIFKSLLQIAGMLILTLITIPIGPVQPAILIIYDGYFMGRGIFDSLLERDFPNSSQRSKELSNLHFESLGVGLATMVWLLIPIIGILIATSLGLIAAFQIRYNGIKSTQA